MKEYEFIGKCLLVEVWGKKILAVGDLHLGYEEALNITGVFVGRKLYDEMISDFEKIFEKTGGVDVVVLLGDVKHYFGESLKQEWGDVLKLFDYFLEKKRVGKIIACKWNHDNYLKTIAGKRNVEVLDFFVAGNFAFLHGDKDFEGIYDKKIKYWVLGHAHPALTLREGAKSERYKCFLVGEYKGKNVLIVPSFFEGNEGTDLRKNESGLAWNFDLNKFEVYAVGDRLGAYDFGKLEKIKS